MDEWINLTLPDVYEVLVDDGIDVATDKMTKQSGSHKVSFGGVL